MILRRVRLFTACCFGAVVGEVEVGVGPNAEIVESQEDEDARLMEEEYNDATFFTEMYHEMQLSNDAQPFVPPPNEEPATAYVLLKEGTCDDPPIVYQGMRLEHIKSAKECKVAGAAMGIPTSPSQTTWLRTKQPSDWPDSEELPGTEPEVLLSSELKRMDAKTTSSHGKTTYWNRQRNCGTWFGKTYLFFNEQESGEAYQGRILDASDEYAAGGGTFQICAMKTGRLIQPQ